MKLKFLAFETKAPAWVDAARLDYTAKINGFQEFQFQTLKSPSAERDASEVKKKKEAEILFKHIDSKDLLIIFDEVGKSFASSEIFARQLAQHLESGKARLVFCIGGPYGFHESVQKRAAARWSLSGLTFNHWVAQVAGLEQIYRAFTILRGLPYHNR